jgi:tetratricopeptide (TPR) repeat protein
MINQNPKEDNFLRMYQALEEAEQRLGPLLAASSDPPGDDRHTLEFFQCLVDYYYMKTCALDGSWVRSVRHAVRARRGALALQAAGYANPDLPYILGDQDYSTALIPPHLKVFLAPLNFSPDREAGISHIRQTVIQGNLMQPEAAILYISANIYVEHNYQAAMETVRDFLQDFPDNLTARFFFIDLLLREGDLSSADQLLAGLTARYSEDLLSGKWEARLWQMQGNRLNAAGDYRGAVELYQRALDHPDFNGFSATEAALEMGKLLDILGDRQGAREAYRLSYRSRGLELLKTEARELRSHGFTGSTGSY